MHREKETNGVRDRERESISDDKGLRYHYYCHYYYYYDPLPRVLDNINGRFATGSSPNPSTQLDVAQNQNTNKNHTIYCLGGKKRNFFFCFNKGQVYDKCLI